MQQTNPTIQILPQKRTVQAHAGERLLEALIRHGIFLRADCGGKSRCGKCQVNLISGSCGSKIINSCQHKVESDIFIQIPEFSMASSHVMDKAYLIFPHAFQEKHRFSPLQGKYGVAVDLGTTTIAIYLCHIPTGEVKASIAVKNSQAIYGDDVMSRISAIGEKIECLEKLHHLVIKNIGWGVEKLFSFVHKNMDSLSRMVVVGNPTMIHIFTKTNPSSIGIAPYRPAFFEAKRFSSKQLGFNFEDISIQTLPNVSGFIGSDTLSALIASEIEIQPDGTLLIDLGTNGELILKKGGSLYATSCATGPAFEGASLSCGMQGVPGAINAIRIGKDKRLSSISIINPSVHSGIKPSGICGAGIINAVAQLYQNKMIRPDGAFSDESEKFILVAQDSTTGQLPVYISQKDIRSIQLGKSALRSGIESLLSKAKLDKPEKIIVAGAMGSHIQTRDLICLGMVPEIDPDKITIAGNLAGAGAVMALCDDHYHDKAALLAGKIKIVELSTDIEFQNAFIKNLKFPFL